MRSTLAIVLLMLAAEGWSAVISPADAERSGRGLAETQSYTPRALLFVPPEFPAVVGKIDGQVELEFGLSNVGAMMAAKVTNTTLADSFAAAVLAVSQHWRFMPDRYDERCKILAEGARRYTFRTFFKRDGDQWGISISQPARPIDPLESKAIEHEQPIYPRRALRAGAYEGCVVAQLRIDESGKVGDVTVLAAAPPNLFDLATTSALLHWTFPKRPADAGPLLEEIEVHYQAQ